MDKIIQQARPVSFSLTDEQLKMIVQESVKTTLKEIENRKEPEEWITRSEFKKETGIQSDTTVIRLEKEGIIRSYRIGGKVRYKRSEISKVFQEKLAV